MADWGGSSAVRGCVFILCLLVRGDSGDLGGCRLRRSLSLLSFSDDELCSLRFKAFEKLHFFVGVLCAGGTSVLEDGVGGIEV